MTPTPAIRPILDVHCAMETLRRWAEHDGPMREVKCPAVALLSCGHRRPVNSRHEKGDVLPCLLECADAFVAELVLLPEPQWFAHPDALADLHTPA